jgi:hypothetical protein
MEGQEEEEPAAIAGGAPAREPVVYPRSAADGSCDPSRDVVAVVGSRPRGEVGGEEDELGGRRGGQYEGGASHNVCDDCQRRA